MSIDIQNRGIEISKGDIRFFIFKDIIVNDPKIVLHKLENENMIIREEPTGWWERNGTKFAILVGGTSIMGVILLILESPLDRMRN